MNGRDIANTVRAADRFVSEILGMQVTYDMPEDGCPGSPHALAIGLCGHVGPHGAHPGDQAPTYKI